MSREVEKLVKQGWYADIQVEDRVTLWRRPNYRGFRNWFLVVATCGLWAFVQVYRALHLKVEYAVLTEDRCGAVHVRFGDPENYVTPSHTDSTKAA